MRKARRLLKSVERRAAEDDPDAVVSTAYYAMFHAACAVVLQRHGRLPKDSRVIDRPIWSHRPRPRSLRPFIRDRPERSLRSAFDR
ncbi:HEPN domain-containing protein [Reyranella sp.]|uniref:HEPN domain-containing protein n=1 Tax=Reyranella sp. TaxID=1929291 RepID=UPI003D10DD0E